MAVLDYATVAEVQAHLPDVNWASDYDAALTTLITRASRLIDAFHGREPGAYAVSTDGTRYFDGSGTAQLWIGELAAAPTLVAVAETGDIRTPTYTVWDSTDYVPWPYDAPDRGIPYLRLDLDVLNGSKFVWYRFPKAVKIVGRHGFSTTAPEEIKEACIIQTVRWFKRGQQAFADVGAIAELGQLRYVKQLDPDVTALLSLPKFQRVTL